jgi:hypothetical protein
MRWRAGGQLKAHSPQADLRACPQICCARGVRGAVGPEPPRQRLRLLARGQANAGVLPNQGQMAIMRRTLPRIVARVIPQALALRGDERADHRRHLLEIVRNIAQVLHGFAQHGHPMTRPISVTGVHPSAFRWIQENMFNQLFMQRRRCERWRVASHSRLTIIVGADFRQDQEPALFWAMPRGIDGVAEDSPAEVPVPKVKTEIRTGRDK